MTQQQNQSQIPVYEEIPGSGAGDTDTLAQIARMEEVMLTETEGEISQIQKEIADIEASLRSVRITGAERDSLKKRLAQLRAKEVATQDKKSRIEGSPTAEQSEGAHSSVGNKEFPDETGGEKKYPREENVSLENAGVTLPSEETRGRIARLYGGTMKPWESEQGVASESGNPAPRHPKYPRANPETRADWLPEHTAGPHIPGNDDFRGRHGAPRGGVSPKQEVLKKEIAEILTTGTPTPTPGETHLETRSGSPAQREDGAIKDRARQYVVERLHAAFGRSGVFGVGATAGVESDEWLMMKDVPVTRVLSRAVPGAREDEIARIGEIVQETGLAARIVPAQGETVEQFLLRGTEEMIRSGKIK